MSVIIIRVFQALQASPVAKESACNAGDSGLIPGLERSLGEGNGNPLQYSCLENSMDRGAWRAMVHEITEEPGGLRSMRLQRVGHD